MLSVVDYKQQMELDIVKREALERHLDFLVGQTERYTRDLTAALAPPAPLSLAAVEHAAALAHPQTGPTSTVARRPVSSLLGTQLEVF